MYDIAKNLGPLRLHTIYYFTSDADNSIAIGIFSLNNAEKFLWVTKKAMYFGTYMKS